ncbi:hypothetical protein A5904_14535 (plasmid) [Acidithiobacillus caldus]|nr:hypothetical protein [Acidithiobacillus caldus]AUW34164.1 hypothetical protein A5904_14535 [Acidithiobacillus caldus]QER43382.1 hypothetical protein F0726_00293 [Acidithiobacillus caldus]
MPSHTVLFAIGTRRGKAEAWIRSLPERFPKLYIRVVPRHELKDLADPTGGDEDVILVDTPYADIGKFRADAIQVLERGGAVYLQYFPAEPLISLIQADQRSGDLLGAESLRTDLQNLCERSDYEAELDVLEKRFADGLKAKKGNPVSA